MHGMHGAPIRVYTVSMYPVDALVPGMILPLSIPERCSDCLVNDVRERYCEWVISTDRIDRSEERDFSFVDVQWPGEFDCIG